METDFWQQRWQNNEIGFHQQTVNPLLRAWWSELQLEPGCQVFVPLCGKSHDMLWLREQGYRVLGIEISEIAVTAFFTENHLSFSRRREGPFQRYETDDQAITLLCGDFFALQSRDVRQCRGCYDRAALVAFPPVLRRRYAARLWEILPPGSRTLLITLRYPAGQMTGPPFTVSEWELFAYFSKTGSVRKLAERDALDERFAAKGLTTLTESAYLLHKTQ